MTRHAVVRAQERYGVALTADDLAEIKARIARGACIVRGQRGRARIVIVELAGVLLRLVHGADGSIITALPPKRRR